MGEKEKNSRTGAVSPAGAPRNVSGEKRSELVSRLAEIESFIQRAPQDENTKTLLEYIAGLKKDLRAKKYGLVFEEHREHVDDDLENNIPVLTEDKKLFINNGGEINFLIEGDNLASLQLMERTHKGKIDFIYIDPPYNTGNEDFIYDDKLVDKTDTFRHSKWLSFMSKRLKIAEELLSERGVIFISIDDNEQAPLKLLCDETFGEDNFVAALHVEMSLTQGKKVSSAQDGVIVKNAEFILVYSKKPNFRASTLLYDGVDNYDKHFSLYLEEADGKLSIVPLGTFLKRDNKDINAFFDRNGMPHTFNSFCKLVERDDKFRELIYQKYSSQIYRTMMAEIKIPPDVRRRLQNEKIVRYKEYILHQTSTGSMDQLLSLSDTIGYTDDYKPAYRRRRIRGDMWKGFYADMMNVAKEGGVKFKNGKKPVRLIKQLAQWGSHKDSVILDFFAGSGTTGEAIMQLNDEDGGRRKFVLCTNNENNICRDITYKRIKNVTRSEGYKASLKYFRVEFVPLTDRLYFEYADELLEHIRELVELENAVNFTSNARIAIILKDEELDAFASSLGETTECEAVYLAHDVLPSDEQRKLFNKKNIKINIIPNYYYKELSTS